MSSNRQKKQRLKSLRERALAKKERKELQEIVEISSRNASIQPVDRGRIRSRSVLPEIPKCYEDTPFTCVDCGLVEIWTARQQKWWYEVAGGDIETKAIRCRKCRRRERERKAVARRVHLEGLAAKEARRAGKTPEGKTG